ncbi:AAA family ATPase [Rubinisphaera margarita]|uniref:AAA family ATPase n=1 Tax=Rubinisphaera margarita TaxID=2909586 RepID=UPI001EE7FD4F|nr:MoxR family ATPase [Rubinisphaera margarita]MCG6156595.1 MoxR family ATPase [Rubinisphaera margarita]
MSALELQTPDLRAEELREKLMQLRRRLNATLKGKADTIEQVLVCLLAQGHLLLEDQPGLGKTTLAKALAEGVGERFARVQCTPDLLPSDVTGFSIFNQKSHEFEFRQGPVFAELLLADEINRATPRTQSALLEAMAERQVTIDTERYRLSPSFFVIATQNPIEQHGTYPLPEAQLDRFAMKLSIGYPEAEDEIAMLSRAVSSGTDEDEEIETGFGPGDLLLLQQEVACIPVSRNVQEYLVALGRLTRRHARVHLGLSPRGLLTWQRCAQACAYLAERRFVTPDDLQHVALPVLSVRLGIDDLDPERVIQEIINEVPVPVAPSSEGTRS